MRLPRLRLCLTIGCTRHSSSKLGSALVCSIGQKGKAFFKQRLVDGKYDESYAAELKPYIDRLNSSLGLVVCEEALSMAKRLHDKCMRFALESDDDAYRELSHRAVTIAYIKAMVLYMAQGCQWSEEIERFADGEGCPFY